MPPGPSSRGVDQQPRKEVMTGVPFQPPDLVEGPGMGSEVLTNPYIPRIQTTIVLMV